MRLFERPPVSRVRENRKHGLKGGLGAASLADSTCRVKVPMIGGFPFDDLA